MKNNIIINLRVSEELFSKLKSTGNASQFLRLAAEEKFVSGDLSLGDETYMTKKEAKELIHTILEDFLERQRKIEVVKRTEWL